MKCIVCGKEFDQNIEKGYICPNCKEWGYVDDLPEDCKKKCQNVWSFPECLWECATIPDEDKYVLFDKYW